MNDPFEMLMPKPIGPGVFEVELKRPKKSPQVVIGQYEVTHNPASGLMCKELKVGGSLQCPGFSNWDKYFWTRVY